MTSVAIIGAGPSGITAAKAALECKLEPTVLEKAASVGGLWKPVSGAVWDSMRTNLSYHSCAFSDMPWQNPSHNFPHQSQVCDYLQRYAEQNKIMPHIQFEAEARKISRSGEKWKVEWVQKGQACSKEFDFLIVASGIFSSAYIPKIPGLATFAGQVLHSHDYKNPQMFKDKVVAVIGNSFSGTEIAAELSLVAKETLHVAKNAMWVLPRDLPAGNKTRPVDLVFYSRQAAAKTKGVAPETKNEGIYNWFKDLTKQHEIAPELAVTSSSKDPSFVAISDTYISQIKAKQIALIRSKVQEIVGNTLHFEDGRNKQVDAIVFATGYDCSLPFFDEATLKVLDFRAEDHLQPLLLHKTVFHPNLPNAAFVGMYRGPYFSTMELQGRLACHVFSKIVPTPTNEAMEAGVAAERQIRQQLPRPQFPHGNYVEFADELAQLAGVLPDLEKLKVSDPVLYTKLWTGPLIAAHYRLSGHASNPDIALQLIDAVNNP